MLGVARDQDTNKRIMVFGKIENGELKAACTLTDIMAEKLYEYLKGKGDI